MSREEPPFISSVRVETIGAHDHVHVWVSGAKSGTLIVSAGDGARLERVLRGCRCPEAFLERYGSHMLGCRTVQLGDRVVVRHADVEVTEIPVKLSDVDTAETAAEKARAARRALEAFAGLESGSR